MPKAKKVKEVKKEKVETKPKKKEDSQTKEMEQEKKVVLDPLDAIKDGSYDAIRDTLYFVYNIRLDWQDYLVDELAAMLKKCIDEEAKGQRERITSHLKKVK